MYWFGFDGNKLLRNGIARNLDGRAPYGYLNLREHETQSVKAPTLGLCRTERLIFEISTLPGVQKKSYRQNCTHQEFAIFSVY